MKEYCSYRSVMMYLRFNLYCISTTCNKFNRPGKSKREPERWLVKDSRENFCASHEAMVIAVWKFYTVVFKFVT